MILFRPWQRNIFFVTTLVVIVLSIPQDRDIGLYYFNSYEYEKAIPYLVQSELTSSGDVFVLKKLKDFALIQGDVKSAYNTQLKLVALKPNNQDYIIEAEKLAIWNRFYIEALELKEKRVDLLRNKSPLLADDLLLEVANGYRFYKNFKEADRVFLELTGSSTRKILDQAIRYFLVRKNADIAQKVLKRYMVLFKGNTEIFNFYYETLVFQNNYSEASLVLLRKIFPKDKWEKLDAKIVNKKISSLDKKTVDENRDELEFLIPLLKSNFTEEDYERFAVEVAGKLERTPLVFIEIGLVYLKETQTEKALRFFHLAESSPRNFFRETNLELASIYNDLKLYEEAIRCLKRLTKRYYKNRSYWGMLAEAYENNGEKEKAIKALLKQYKLEKDIVILNFEKWVLNGIRFAQIGRISPSELANKDINKSKKEKAIASLEKRIVDSIYGIEDFDKRILAFDELLKENPTSNIALKGRAYSYFDKGDQTKAISLFKEIHELYPDDVDALSVLLGVWQKEKDWNSLRKAEKSLKESYNEIELNILFRDYYWEKNLKQYQKTCQELTLDKVYESKIQDFEILLQSAKIECNVRKGDIDNALKLSRNFQELAPNQCNRKIQRIFLEIDVGDLDWAYLNTVEDKKCLERRQKDEILKLYYAQDHFRRGARIWRWEQSFSYLRAGDFSFGVIEEGLSRKLENWSLGIRGELTKVLSDGKSSFPLLGLEYKYFGQSGSVFTIGPTFLGNEKDTRLGFLVGYSLNQRNIFMSFNFLSNNPLRFSSNLAEESSAYASQGEFYLNFRSEDRRWNLLGFALLQNINFRESSSFGSQFTFEGLRRFYSNNKVRPIELYTGVQLSTSGLSSAKDSFSQNFLRKSTAIHFVLKSDFNFPDNFMPSKWSGFFRLGVGGDSNRGVDFFDSLQVSGAINKAISKRAKISLTGEYYSEFLGINRGNTRVFRFDFIQDFW
ncbi:MAG: tetratricopeptide repeat protein [Bacteriovoracaceae bacterium]|nr:tetratricopeptide repeat protein [Bacteriovoracaceae bacterium]